MQGRSNISFLPHATLQGAQTICTGIKDFIKKIIAFKTVKQCRNQSGELVREKFTAVNAKLHNDL